jgi:hypothetical protein
VRVRSTTPCARCGRASAIGASAAYGGSPSTEAEVPGDRPGARCARHRDALLDFIDRRELAPGTTRPRPPARCRPARGRLEATAMAVATLRRLHREARAVEPPAEAWLLRPTDGPPRGPVWRWRTSWPGWPSSRPRRLIAPVSIWSPRLGYLRTGTDAIFSAQRLASSGPDRDLRSAALPDGAPGRRVERARRAPRHRVDRPGRSRHQHAGARRQNADWPLTMSDETLQQRR